MDPGDTTLNGAEPRHIVRHAQRVAAPSPVQGRVKPRTEKAGAQNYNDCTKTAYYLQFVDRTRGVWNATQIPTQSKKAFVSPMEHNTDARPISLARETAKMRIAA